MQQSQNCSWRLKAGSSSQRMSILEWRPKLPAWLYSNYLLLNNDWAIKNRTEIMTSDWSLDKEKYKIQPNRRLDVTSYIH